MAALIGSCLGPYEILAALGAGGMGAVYRARDTRLGRDVAIKVLPPDVVDSEEALARFEREARAVAALNHPNILALHDVGRDGGIAYAVTELLEGETLRDAIANGPLPPRRALDALAQVARGLGAAHDRGIVHRDIKPENLFLTRDGRVKILDFGIATYADPAEGTTRAAAHVTQPGTVIGTPTYMAPEQLAAEPATARSDLFAFGLVAHELLTGVHPFKQNTVTETIRAILRDDPAPLGPVAAALPPGAARVLGRCLEKVPSERPGSARDLALYLDALATAPDAHSATDAARASSSIVRVARRRVLSTTLATGVVIIVLTWGYAAMTVRRAASGASAADLTRTQRLVQQVQGERLLRVALTADLLTSYPEVRALFDTDAATVRDFLVTHQAFVPGTPTLIALRPGGGVVARTDTVTPAPPAPNDTWVDTLITKDAGPAIVTIDGRPYHAASAAAAAGGNTFAYIVAAMPVDQEFARVLSDLTQDEVLLLADGVVATTIRGTPPWTSLREWHDAGGRPDRTLPAAIAGRRFDAHEIPLSTHPAVAAVVANARDTAVSPLAGVQRALAMIALITLAVAIGGAYWSARSALA